jgi:peptide/nickel transport system substrate-binding protein
VHVRRPWVIALLSVLVFAAACEASSQSRSASSEAPIARSSPKRLTAAIRGTPAGLSQQKTMRTVGNIPGLDAIEELTHAGMTHADDRGLLHPQLAEAVPTVENGLWRVFPDGRMETTWKLKPNARWHDGAPVTAGDFAFGARVESDRELGVPGNATFDLIEAIALPDPVTITVRWKQPFIEADAMFSYAIALPIPRHLVEGAYTEDKASFLGVPYWTQDFIGAGPYHMREWVLDSHMILQAFDGYVLGRPKISDIEIRFIPDPNAIVANLLAEAADLTLGRSLLTVEQAQEVLNQWRDARLATSYVSWAVVHAQFINTNPPIVADVRFRKALIQAIDRQQMMETFMGGQSSVTHTFVGPDSAEYREVEPSIVKYDYDPRRAGQMIEALGYARGNDGLFVDGSGQRLILPIQTTIRSEINPKMLLAVADYWKQIGVETDQFFVPIQRINDRELRATFPAFEVLGAGDIGVSPDVVRRYHSSLVALPENRFQVTGNNPRYRSPELDSLIERYVITIPRSERMSLLGQIVHQLSDQLPSPGAFLRSGLHDLQQADKRHNQADREGNAGVERGGVGSWLTSSIA